MNYEKKYKDALSWIKNVYPMFEGAVKEDAEHFFPELKESEDEKIRKEIIEVFKSLGEGKIPVDINYADIFTWLEKQGEQKVSVVDFKAKDWYVSKVDGKIYNAKFMEKTPNNQARRLEIEKAAISATGIIEREEWFIKGAEWADKTMIDKACKWLDKHMCNKSNGIKVKDYQSVGELIYNLRKEIWE